VPALSSEVSMPTPTGSRATVWPRIHWETSKLGCNRRCTSPRPPGTRTVLRCRSVVDGVGLRDRELDHGQGRSSHVGSPTGFAAGISATSTSLSAQRTHDLDGNGWDTGLAHEEIVPRCSSKNTDERVPSLHYPGRAAEALAPVIAPPQTPYRGDA
jgi:hypothetical protein